MLTGNGSKTFIIKLETFAKRLAEIANGTQ